MSNDALVNEDNLARARDLQACIEAGDESGAKEIIDDLTDIRENALYQEVGKLTRELHDAISAFGMDDRIADITEHDIPDARQRLNFVITKTADAADRTLTAVEESIPICENMEAQAAEILESWRQFTQREMDAQGFRKLSKEIDGFLLTQSEGFSALKAHLNDVLMAQDFQDLTGQIITRVINLVAEVEGNLVSLIKLAGLPEHNEQPREKSRQELEGPAVPGVDSGDTVSGQDEVDDLLSSLGF
ncbi:MAG TPA: protein phosphatase CheZ [Gammaproteobacteria bacterium]|nr:protein phosphatase CheZ [Gammaproteobacteria bacterium]